MIRIHLVVSDTNLEKALPEVPEEIEVPRIQTSRNPVSIFPPDMTFQTFNPPPAILRLDAEAPDLEAAHTLISNSAMALAQYGRRVQEFAKQHIAED